MSIINQCIYKGDWYKSPHRHLSFSISILTMSHQRQFDLSATINNSTYSIPSSSKYKTILLLPYFIFFFNIFFCTNLVSISLSALTHGRTYTSFDVFHKLVIGTDKPSELHARVNNCWWVVNICHSLQTNNIGAGAWQG